jgi:hypothetical protein
LVEVGFLQQAAPVQVHQMLLALLGRIALDRPGHAAGPATATAEFAAWHLDHLDAVLAQHSVDGDVAVVAQDDAGATAR